MNTDTKNNNGKLILAVAVVGILVIAALVGVCGFFGNSKIKADLRKSEQLQTNPQTIEKTKDETLKAEQTEILPNKSSDVPKALVDAGEFGENIYDAAKLDDWKIAETRLNELKAAVKNLDNQKIGSPALDTTLANLEKAVSSKNKNAALEQSNTFTLEAADLTGKYNPKIPVKVTKLDYYGREIEIWAGEKDEAKLKSTTAEIRKTWDAVKPKIEAHNGTKQAAVFEDLVKKTEAAKSISDYAKLANPILDEVDNLENVFG